MQNTRKSYWSNDKKSDPAKAPNCISPTKKHAEKFKQASTLILAKVDEVRRGHLAPATSLLNVGEDASDPLATLERLGKLKDAGVVTEEEFQAK